MKKVSTSDKFDDINTVANKLQQISNMNTMRACLQCDHKVYCYLQNVEVTSVTLCLPCKEIRVCHYTKSLKFSQ